MEETRLHNLLVKPFGPFIDSLVLDKKCTTTGKESVVLSSLIMECGGEAIGWACLGMYFSELVTTEAHPGLMNLHSGPQI